MLHPDVDGYSTAVNQQKNAKNKIRVLTAPNDILFDKITILFCDHFRNWEQRIYRQPSTPPSLNTQALVLESENILKTKLQIEIA